MSAGERNSEGVPNAEPLTNVSTTGSLTCIKAWAAGPSSTEPECTRSALSIATLNAISVDNLCTISELSHAIRIDWDIATPLIFIKRLSLAFACWSQVRDRARGARIAFADFRIRSWRSRRTEPMSHAFPISSSKIPVPQTDRPVHHMELGTISVFMMWIKVTAEAASTLIRMWKEIRIAPFDRDLQLAVIEGDDVHALVFACRRSSKDWVNSETQEIVVVRSTHWREWKNLLGPIWLVFRDRIGGIQLAMGAQLRSRASDRCARANECLMIRAISVVKRDRSSLQIGIATALRIAVRTHSLEVTHKRNDSADAHGPISRERKLSVRPLAGI